MTQQKVHIKIDKKFREGSAPFITPSMLEKAVDSNSNGGLNYSYLFNEITAGNLYMYSKNSVFIQLYFYKIYSDGNFDIPVLKSIIRNPSVGVGIIVPNRKYAKKLEKEITDLDYAFERVNYKNWFF